MIRHPAPTRSHLASCAKCKAEARLRHNLTHRSPETQALMDQDERRYAELDLEFQREREAELAAVARGVKPVPGQWKLDQGRLTAVEAVPEAPVLTIYRDLWHEEAVS